MIFHGVFKMKVIFNSQQGKEAVGIDKPFILVLNKDENLHEAIQRFAEDAQLPAASMSGLGALGEVTVAFYHLDRKEYDTKLFEGEYELISLNGNISQAEGKYITHIHAALGQADYTVVGGHIMDGIVSVTAEITIIPFRDKIERKQCDDVGLRLLCPIKT